MTFYEYKTLSSQRGWRFKKVVKENILNIEYIHPLKQCLIAEIVKCAMQDDGVKSIRVFGSSITDNCDPQSDLDLCIDWNFNCYDSSGVLIPETVSFMKNISLITKGNCDVVHYQYLDGTIVEGAAREGVLVYVHDVKQK